MPPSLVCLAFVLLWWANPAGGRHFPRIRAANATAAPKCPALRYTTGPCPNATQFHGCPLTAAARAGFLRMGDAAADPLPMQCGFHSPTSYDVVRDHYLTRHECKVIIVTVIFRYYDNLWNPAANLTEMDFKEVCWVALLDHLSVSSPVLGQPFNVTVWELWRLETLPYSAPFLVHKSSLVCKTLQHRLFPNALFTVYVDGKVRLAVGPWALLARTLGVPAAAAAAAPPAGLGRAQYYAAHCNGGLAVLHQPFFLHSAHEFQTELTRLRHNRSAIRAMWEVYRKEDNVTRGPWRLAIDSSIVVRAHFGPHRRCADLFGCVWWNEVVYWHHHSREQLSYPRVLSAWKLTGIFSYFTTASRLFHWYPHRYQYKILRISKMLPKGFPIPRGGYRRTAVR
eukprot:EG_transcript_11423